MRNRTENDRAYIEVIRESQGVFWGEGGYDTRPCVPGYEAYGTMQSRPCLGLDRTFVLDNWDSLAQARAQSTHHDGLRHRFLDFLQNAFPSLDAKELELEYPVKALGIRGYIDALYRHVLFEFKRDLSREGAKGREELQRYISAQAESQRYIGVLTDGESFEVYVPREGDLEQAYTFRLDADKPQESWLWLEGLLFSQKQVRPTAQDVVRRFGEKSAVFAQARARLWQIGAECGVPTPRPSSWSSSGYWPTSMVARWEKRSCSYATPTWPCWPASWPTWPSPGGSLPTRNYWAW
jgi:hypothetical protein